MTKEDSKSAVLRVLRKRLPILTWLPKYNSDTAIADLIAGLTVGLTVMPQGLAYAALAGLDTQFGLYSAFMGCFVYAIMGGCKDITIGPTALMSLMTYQQVYNRNSDYAVLLCFLTGCVQLLMAPLRLGVLVEFISQPVTVGFTTATSVIIVASQLKGLFGLSFNSEGFVDTIRQVAVRVHEISMWDTTMGLVCIVILLFMKKMKEIFRVDKMKPTKNQRILSKSLWLLSLSRNALIVVVCSTIALFLHSDSAPAPIKLTGNVRPGLPQIQLPPFSTHLGNRTIGFSEMITDLGSSIILVPIIAVLGNVAIAKAFASGETLDATQELLTLGTCNILGSFVSAMPVTGSFSRSAVNHASGVKTPLGGVYTGVVILLSLSLLTPYFYYIPKASLAAVIICAVIFMIEVEVIRPMWKASKKDMLPMVSTFLVCLFYSVEIGIVVGVAVNIAILMFVSARPNMNIERMETSGGVEYMKITPTSNVYFPGVEHLRSTLLSSSYSHLPILVDCSLMMSTDFTTAKVISSLLSEFHSSKRPIFFYNVSPGMLQALAPICNKNFITLSSQDQVCELLADHEVPESNPKGATEMTVKRSSYTVPIADIKETVPSEEPLLQQEKRATIVEMKPREEP